MRKENEDNRLRKICVGGLAWKTTSDDLRRYFQRFGEFVDACIIYEPSTGKSRGFGFVRFKDDESAARALENQNPIIDGRTTNFNLAHTKNHHKQKGSSNDHAEPSHRYQSNPQQASTISTKFSISSYNRLILYQNWMNLAQQNHVNNNTDQQNSVVVDNDQDVITIVDGDVDDQLKLVIIPMKKKMVTLTKMKKIRRKSSMKKLLKKK